MGTGIKYDFSHLKILLVEDTKINHLLMQNIFEVLNITKYDIAVNGIEAIGYSYQNEYDLIIMDVEMPYMDGNTATKIIKNNLELETPIYACTTLDSDEDKVTMDNIGYEELIKKPIDFSQLLNVLNNVSGIKKCEA
ncbi:response regulator [Mycoplasmatota bacterium WC44]